MSEKNEKPLLSLDEVCDKVGYTRQGIWHAVRGKRFPEPIRINGRCICWLPSVIDAWLEEKNAKRRAKRNKASL
jgi:predicted DNA-binding transcriptional regulator AlpA